MPRFDGTGPQGRGPRTGRGLGYCDTDGNRNNFQNNDNNEILKKLKEIEEKLKRLEEKEN